MELGQKLRFLRLKSHYTQEELVQGICSISYYSKIENSKVVPNEEILQLLADRFGVPKSEFVDEASNSKKLMDEAHDIYKLIQQKRIQEAEDAYQQLLGKYKEQFNLTTKFICDLIDLRFTLRNPITSETKQKYQEIEALETLKTNDIIPLYNRVCGLYHYMTGDYDKALELYLVLVNMIDYPHKSDIHYELSLVYNRKNNIYQSIQHLEKALDAYLQDMNYEQCTNCYFLLGINHFKMKQFDDAIDFYKRVEKVAKGDNGLLRKVYHNLGLAYEKKKDIVKATYYYRESLLFETSDVSKLKTVYLLAALYYHIDNKEAAIAYIDDGDSIAKQHAVEEYQIKFHVLRLQVNGEDVKDYIEQVAIPFFKEKKDTEILNDYYILLSNHYSGKKQYKQAYLSLKKVLEMDG